MATASLFSSHCEHHDCEYPGLIRGVALPATSTLVLEAGRGEAGRGKAGRGSEPGAKGPEATTVATFLSFHPVSLARF